MSHKEKLKDITETFLQFGLGSNLTGALEFIYDELCEKYNSTSCVVYEFSIVIEDNRVWVVGSFT